MQRTPRWIEKAASDILDTTSELRRLLRAHHYAPAGTQRPQRQTTRAAADDWQTITITTREARTLLRAAMPAPVASTRHAREHASILAAIQRFSALLVTLNDPLQNPEHGITAGLHLAVALDGWLIAARWSAAARKAGIRWKQPEKPLSIMELTQHQTGETVPGLFDLETLAALGEPDAPQRSKRAKEARQSYDAAETTPQRRRSAA